MARRKPKLVEPTTPEPRASDVQEVAAEQVAAEPSVEEGANPDAESAETEHAQSAPTIEEAGEGAQAAVEDPIPSGPEDSAADQEPSDTVGTTPPELVLVAPATDADEVLPAGASDAPASTSSNHLKHVLESLIFVSDRPITLQALARHVKAKQAEVQTLIEQLVEDYRGRGIELVEAGGGFQFRSAPATAPFVRDLVAHRPVRLTRAQLETLALVAYRQPITRPEVDDVRGVDSGSAIKVLLDRGLLKMLGRKDEAGRPLLYGTSPYFLEFFGLKALKDLPTLREFSDLSDESRELFKRKLGEPPQVATESQPLGEALATEDEFEPDAEAEDEMAKRKPQDDADLEQEPVGVDGDEDLGEEADDLDDDDEDDDLDDDDLDDDDEDDDLDDDDLDDDDEDDDLDDDDLDDDDEDDEQEDDEDD